MNIHGWIFRTFRTRRGCMDWVSVQCSCQSFTFGCPLCGTGEVLHCRLSPRVNPWVETQTREWKLKPVNGKNKPVSGNSYPWMEKTKPWRKIFRIPSFFFLNPRWKFNWRVGNHFVCPLMRCMHRKHVCSQSASSTFSQIHEIWLGF